MYTLENDRKYSTLKLNTGKSTPKKMKEWKMHTKEKGRKITPWKMLESHYWNMIDWKMHTMENDRKEIAHGVHFPFYHFPWCAISILSFSMVYIFHSFIFKWFIFYHFPECTFSNRFHGVHFLLCHFPGCSFSIMVE